MKGGWAVVNTSGNALNLKAAGGTPATTSVLTVNPRVTGMVNFDFGSKAKTARKPRGENLINLILENLEFNSLNYDYRALSGARTQFKGFGKVNNEAGYKYILTVIDGQAPNGGGVDKFRIKIWNDKTGEVVFDNQMGESDDADPTTPVGDGHSISFPK